MKLVAKTLVFSIIFVYIFNYGFQIIHYINFQNITERQIAKLREEYFNLEKINTKFSKAEMDKIRLFFKVYGMELDEGHEADSAYQEWSYIFQYYLRR